MSKNPKKSEKPKATQNTANFVESKQPKPTVNLWAEYGRLQAEREKAENAFKLITERMRQIQLQIQEIER